MAYGIDELIEQKTDAYRGNPAALEQRSKMSNELVDLLALQKLKSEKDAAARNMQMQIQTQPDTIAKQLEAEMVGRTKDEVLQGVSGVLATNKARQQQRVASLGIAPQPRPNMQKMAQGGIVGFASGGTVVQQIKAIQADDSLSASEKETRIQQVISGTADAQSRQTMRDFSGTTDKDIDAKLPGAVTSAVQTAAELAADDSILAQFRKPEENYSYDDLKGSPFDNTAPATEQNQEQEQPAPEPEKDPMAEGIAGLQKIAVPKRGELDPGTAALEAQRRALASNLAAIDPKAERAEGLAFAEKALGREEKAEQYADMMSRLEALNKEQMDPDKLRNERLMATLLGAQGSTISQALGSSGRAGMEAGRQQEIAKRQRVMDELNLQSKAIEVDVDLGKSAIGSANFALQQAAADRREGSEALGKISGEEKTKLENDVKNMIEVDKANLRADTEMLKLKSQALDRKELRRSTDITAISKQINDINSKALDMYDNLMENDMGFQTALMTHAANIQKGASAEELAQSQAAVNSARDRIYQTLQIALAGTGILTARDALEKRLNSLVGTTGQTGSAGITSSNVTGITKKSP